MKTADPQGSGSKSKRGTEVAALFYTIFVSAKLCGLEPRAYLRQAVVAGLRGDVVPLPSELAVRVASDSGDHT